LRHKAAQLTPVSVAQGLPWRRSILWLLFLGPFFFWSYGYSNHLAASRAVADSIAFDWERHIPFVPWTIVPYWSIDLFYGLSFLLCRSSRQVDRHALRLLTAQLISISCFILFPLRFAFERPDTDGIFGLMFDILMGFDQPYNQAPSLHISLLVILWVRFMASTQGVLRIATHIWSALICISVLTTYQHHFIDIPTGLAAGLFCLWLWPDADALPIASWRLADSPSRLRLAGYYLLAALIFSGMAVYFAGIALWLWWPAISLALVSLIYVGVGVQGFQKAQGKLSVAATVLLAPYLAGAWLNSRWWTRHHKESDEIADGVWLGRMPTRRDMQERGFTSLLDMTAELPAPQGAWHYTTQPWLDLVPPSTEQLAQAARHIEVMHREGTVLVCCALGYSRSACAIGAWLLFTGRAKTVDEAAHQIAARRTGVVLGAAHKHALACYLSGLGDRND
jgi:protein-tyrosine phosphatase/membrane-associated phospholipid phosphatase